MSHQNARPDPAAKPYKESPSGRDTDRTAAVRDNGSRAAEKEPSDRESLLGIHGQDRVRFLSWVDPDDLEDGQPLKPQLGELFEEWRVLNE